MWSFLLEPSLQRAGKDRNFEKATRNIQPAGTKQVWWTEEKKVLKLFNQTVARTASTRYYRKPKHFTRWIKKKGWKDWLRELVKQVAKFTELHCTMISLGGCYHFSRTSDGSINSSVRCRTQGHVISITWCQPYFKKNASSLNLPCFFLLLFMFKLIFGFSLFPSFFWTFWTLLKSLRAWHQLLDG